MERRLSDELALRIGVAARCLPGVGIPELVEALVDALGLPITAEKLGSLTTGRLRRKNRPVLRGMPGIHLGLALSYLNGATTIRIADEPAPRAVDPYRDGDMAGSLRVAVASDGGERLDGDFLTSRRFLIYQIAPAELRLVAVRENPGASHGRDRLRARLRQVADCRLVCARAIGTPARAALAGIGVHPVGVPETGPARETLTELQHILGGHPPPWLARAAQ